MIHASDQCELAGTWEPRTIAILQRSASVVVFLCRCVLANTDEATLKSVLGKGINWLDRATRTYAATSASSKPQRFSGATRGLLLHKPATLATKFTVAVSVRQMPNTNGYIFAQSAPSGDHASRFFSLYSSGTRGDLTVYFVNYVRHF